MWSYLFSFDPFISILSDFSCFVLSCLALSYLLQSYTIRSYPIHLYVFIHLSICLFACLFACLSVYFYIIFLSIFYLTAGRILKDRRATPNMNMITIWLIGQGLRRFYPWILSKRKRGCRRIFAVLTWKTEAESEPTMGTAIPGWAQVLQYQLLLPVVSIFDCSKWLAPLSWLVPCCWAAVHSWPPSCLPLAAPMCLLLQQALEPQQLWPRPPWWHHRQHLLMRAPCGSLLCPPLALASPLAWLQLVRVLARALLPADALMASLASLRWQMTCEVCCCCPWHSWSPWRFMAWWLPWCSSSPTHSSSERPNPEAGRARNLFSEAKRYFSSLAWKFKACGLFVQLLLFLETIF